VEELNIDLLDVCKKNFLAKAKSLRGRKRIANFAFLSVTVILCSLIMAAAITSSVNEELYNKVENLPFFNFVYIVIGMAILCLLLFLRASRCVQNYEDFLELHQTTDDVVEKLCE
jgi:Ni/Fe-hydrogenase subunit HybB-like protein